MLCPLRHGTITWVCVLCRSLGISLYCFWYALHQSGAANIMHCLLNQNKDCTKPAATFLDPNSSLHQTIQTEIIWRKLFTETSKPVSFLLELSNQSKEKCHAQKTVECPKLRKHISGYFPPTIFVGTMAAKQISKTILTAKEWLLKVYVSPKISLIHRITHRDMLLQLITQLWILFWGKGKVDSGVVIQTKWFQLFW